MKQRKTTLFIAALTALVLLGGIAFSVVKAQNSNPEAPLPEPEVSRNAQSPTDFETRMEQRNQTIVPPTIAAEFPNETPESQETQPHSTQTPKPTCKGFVKVFTEDFFRSKSSL